MTTTPNLGLVLETGITAISRQNLYRIDQLAAIFSPLENGDTQIFASNDIKLTTAHDILIGSADPLTTSITLRASSIVLAGTTSIEGLSHKYVNLDFAGSSLTSIEDQVTVIANNSAVAANTTHRSRIDNPHHVTASQVGAYSSLEVDGLLELKLNSSIFNSHALSKTTHGAIGELADTAGVQTLTNKSIDADSNSLSNISNVNIKSTAAIEGTKISPNFGSQPILTSSYLQLESLSDTFRIIPPQAGSLSSYDLELPETAAAGAGNLLAVKQLNTSGEGRTQVELTWTSALTNLLVSGHVLIGDAGNEAVQVDTSTLGDISANSSTGLSIKSGAISNSHINGSAAIAWSKIVPGSHTTLSDIGSNTHSQIDSFISTNTPKITQSLANSCTSLRTGGIVTASLTPNCIDITSGTGIHVDVWTTPATPALTEVSWTSSTAIPLTYLTTADATYIYYTKAGVLGQQSTVPTPEERRDRIYIGSAAHPGGTLLATTQYTTIISSMLAATIEDIEAAIGPIKTDGFQFSTNGDLTFNIGAGYGLASGNSYRSNPKDPNNIYVSAVNILPFGYSSRNGTGGFNRSGYVTNVDPTKWDNGSGTLQTVGLTQWTIQRLYYTGSIGVMTYGQAVYSTHTEAIEALMLECHIKDPIADDLWHLGYILTRGDCTNLSDSRYAVLIRTSMLPETVGSVCGSTLPTNTFRQVQTDVKDPTGFIKPIDNTTSTISFTDLTRTFTITPVGDQFDYYVKGVKYFHKTAQSVVIPNTEGVHLIYFNNETLSSALAGTLTDEQIISDYCLTAIVYWDATNAKHLMFNDERHGSSMDWQTHLYLHQTRSTAYGSGLGIDALSVDGTGNDAANAEIAVAGGVIHDEDIRWTITDGSPQVLSPIAQIPILYRSGLDSDHIWRIKSADNYPMIYSGTAGYTGANGRLPYNQLTGGSWALTQIGNGSYVLVHLYATTSPSVPIVGIQGQASYGTVTAARDRANTEIARINAGALPSKEMKAIGTIILQSGSAYGNVPKARVISTSTGAEYVDFRLTSFVTASAATAHGGLTGLANDDHLQYALLAGRSGGQTLIGGSGASENLVLQSTSNATRGNVIADADAFKLRDRTDVTKVAAFSSSGITTGNTRTYTFPDVSGTVAVGKTYKADWITGDGVTKAITHNIGSLDIQVEVFDKANGETILVDSIIRTDINTLTLTSSVSPNASGFRVLIREVL